MWMLRGQADGASLKLTDEGIEFAQPMPAMCCLKTVKFSVPYESVIRVDLEVALPYLRTTPRHACSLYFHCGRQVGVLNHCACDYLL
jgi:hypothetical protein